MTPPAQFYRYDEVQYEYYVRVHLYTFDLIKETPCGYWIYMGPDWKKWVSKTSRKRYAYPTKLEAETSFIARKKAQIGILNAQLNRAKDALSYVERHIHDTTSTIRTKDHSQSDRTRHH